MNSRRLAPRQLAAIAGVAGVAACLLAVCVPPSLEKSGGGPAPATQQQAVIPPPPPPRLTEIIPDAASASRPQGSAFDDAPVAGWRMAEQIPGHSWAGLTTWPGDSEISWRTATPAGNSTPTLVNDHVVVTGVDTDHSLRLIALDIKTGAEAWKVEVCRGGLPSRHEKTSDAAATPCAIGNTVIVLWAADGRSSLAAFDTQGRRLWTTDLGPFNAGWGLAASPLVVAGRVIVAVDNATQGFISAVDPEHGTIVWRRARPAASEGSYSSPVLVHGDPQHVVLAGLDGVRGYAVDDGRVLWEVGGFGTVSAATPVVADGILVASSGFAVRTMLGLDVARSGSPPTVVWQEDKPSLVPYVPSPVARAGKLWVLNDDGLAHCREITSGRILWRTRIGGTFSASPILLDDLLLCVDEAGVCTLVDATTGEKRGGTTMPAGCMATPVPLGDGLLVRTATEVIRISVPGPKD